MDESIDDEVRELCWKAGCAFNWSHPEEARRLAARALDLLATPSSSSRWERSDALHKLHEILGLVDLKNGDRPERWWSPPTSVRTTRWAELRHLPLALGFVGAWSMPIKSPDGKVLGTFGTYYRDRRSPTPEERAGIEVLAAAAALALVAR